MASASLGRALNSRLSGTDELRLKNTLQFKRICPTQACTKPTRAPAAGSGCTIPTPCRLRAAARCLLRVILCQDRSRRPSLATSLKTGEETVGGRTQCVSEGQNRPEKLPMTLNFMAIDETRLANPIDETCFAMQLTKPAPGTASQAARTQRSLFGYSRIVPPPDAASRPTRLRAASKNHGRRQGWRGAPSQRP